MSSDKARLELHDPCDPLDSTILSGAGLWSCGTALRVSSGCMLKSQTRLLTFERYRRWLGHGSSGCASALQETCEHFSRRTGDPGAAGNEGSDGPQTAPERRGWRSRLRLRQGP
eukprot:scaffold1878_cov258-Pinguiococcus_pyrenoidosus.AAC.5